MPSDPLLTSSEVARRAARAPTARDLTPAQRALASENLALAHFVLLRSFRSYQRDPVIWPALEAAAVSGLCEAAFRYSADYRVSGKKSDHAPLAAPVKFSTFASTTIWGVINRELDRHRDKPIAVLFGALDGDGFDTALTDTRCSRNLTDADRASPHASAAADIPDQVVASDAADRLARAIKLLDPTDREIVCHIHGICGYTAIGIKETSVLVGLSRERTRQRELRALHALGFVLQTGRMPVFSFTRPVRDKPPTATKRPDTIAHTVRDANAARRRKLRERADQPSLFSLT